MAFSHGIKSNAQKEVNSRGPWRLTRRVCAAGALACLTLTSLPLRADDPPPEPDAPTAPAVSPAAPDNSAAPANPATPESTPAPAPTSTPGSSDPGPGTSPTPSAPEANEPLPDIEARDFAVKISKRSTSTNTYLFDDVSDTRTHPGKILLLRREAEPIMAFRVVKVYPDKKQFAAKRVRRYGSYHVLDPGDSYMALEKVGDVAMPPPTAQDKADLKELETGAPAAGAPTPPTAPGPEVRPFDADLDAGNSPPPSGGVDTENAKSNPHDDNDDDPEDRFGVTIDEVTPLDPNHQWLTASFGYFNNAGSLFAGGGLRYGLSLGKMIFLRRAHVQDSIVVEGGAFFYKIINFQSEGDSYSVLPLVGTVRYNILFGENFGIFFYGGVVQNIVTQASGGANSTNTPQVAAALQSVLPAAGGGLLFRVGPNWDARVDLGYDMIGLGLVLRF